VAATLLALTAGTVAFALGGGALVALLVFTWWRSRLGPQAPGAECLRASCRDVNVGGAIRLGGFGDEGEDVVLTIAKRARVRLGDEEWLELSGEYKGRTLAVEWRPKRVVAYKRTALPPESIGLVAVQLEGAAPGGAPIAVADGSLRVEEAGDAIRESAGAGDSLAVRTWGLLDEDKRRFVRVERVGERAPLVSEGMLVASDAIEIVRLGSAGGARGPA
jgi:hypothetical protein